MNIINYYNELLEKTTKLITGEIDETVLSQEFEEINNIINIYKNISTEKYNDKINKINDFINKYINHNNLSFDKKLEALFIWNQAIYNRKIHLDKSLLFKYLNDEKYYYKLFEFIKSNIITFDKEDIKDINIEFIHYIIKNNDIQEYNYIINNNNEIYANNNIKMTNVEKFLINSLMYYTDINITNELLLLLIQHTDIKLSYFPSGNIKKFSGDLLSNVIEYYNNHSLSILIKYRRNVSILMDDKSYNYYYFDDCMKNKNIFASDICIEFPYMCYGYISKIEIECEKSTTNFYISNGYEYVFLDCIVVEKPDKSNIEYNKTTLIKENKDCNMPCSFIKIHFNKYTHIYNVKLYGEVISLI
jgi:hypothetical protein